jgi:general secretion pathway protein B
MSYILDALKRADAERQRGHVPGLHTRSSPELDATAPTVTQIDTRQRLLLLLLAVLLAVLLVMGALWWWLGEAPAATVAAPTTTTAPEAPSSPPSPAPEPPVSAQPDEPAPPPLPILSPVPPRPPAKTATPPADAAPADPKRPATESAPGNAGAATAPVRSFAELTPEARARLPAVNVSGSTYSKNPALRMLIINGKVVQEGGEIASGLTLETIEPRSAVLNHQGMRYRIGY